MYQSVILCLLPIGRQYLRRLVWKGIKCSYVLINAVSYIMKEVGQLGENVQGGSDVISLPRNRTNLNTTLAMMECCFSTNFLHS